MSIEEYFKEWTKVIDKGSLITTMKWLEGLNPNTFCPSLRDMFKAFELCSYSSCKVIFVGQDPYPQRGVATGLLFGNNVNIQDDDLSPSLKIIKDATINLDIPQYSSNFDPSLESWAKQGVLLLNSALTVECNNPGSHVQQWRPFIAKLLSNLSKYNTGLVYVLFGAQAQTFEPYINKTFNYILKEKHPAYYARNNAKMSNKVFRDINQILFSLYKDKIEWWKSIEL